MGNIAIFSGSVFAGPRRYNNELMLNEDGREIAKNSTVWRLQRHPIMPEPSTQRVNISGIGAAGAYLEPGLWVLNDADDNTFLLDAPSLPQAQIILLRWEPSTNTDTLWAYDMDDAAVLAASVGGGPMPIVSRNRQSQGFCRLVNIPEGIHAVIKYKTEVQNNVWVVSFGQNGADAIDLFALSVPTTTVLADSTTDITVMDGDTQAEVVSLNAQTGEAVLSAAPTNVPKATYWALVGEVFG